MFVLVPDSIPTLWAIQPQKCWSFAGSPAPPPRYFQARIERESLPAEVTARAFGHPSLLDAHELTALIAAHQPERPAAARWLARVTAETPPSRTEEGAASGLLQVLDAERRQQALAPLRDVTGTPPRRSS
jgi:hypothetical protein